LTNIADTTIANIDQFARGEPLTNEVNYSRVTAK
jgi:hypothetical protein